MQALALAPILTRKFAKFIPTYTYSEKEFYQLDDASNEIIEQRKQGIAYLQTRFQALYPNSLAFYQQLKTCFSDLRFTDANRVPFQFSHFVNEKLNVSAVVTESHGPYLKDLDGNDSLDISGSYGCNVVGYDFYKSCITAGWEKVKQLRPVLGPLHPLVADNIKKIQAFSGLNEVSFHMSGTEAVMAAIRVARFNTKRKQIVVFSGAYHGWWDGVQSSLGSEREIRDCLLLKDMHEKSLQVIIKNANHIAAIVINPIQSFHPNASPPNDAMLIASDLRSTDNPHRQYKQWLDQVREICTHHNIPLIFDEVYTGFRLAPGGAQEYFGLKADMVVYGKTVAGGMPIGVVCGKTELMKRFDENHPLRLAYVVGTFSAHPLTMGTMHEFLTWAEKPETRMLYQEKNREFADWAAETNTKLEAAELPIQITYITTVWTVLFKQSGCYNWLFQYYLRAEGLTLSWVGSGRCLVSFDLQKQDYQALQTKIMQAAEKMKRDGWWWLDANNPLTDKKIKKRVLTETLSYLIPLPSSVKSFVSEIMQRKHHDHIASHSNLINQFLHFISSSLFIYSYFILFNYPVRAVQLGLLALLIRQAGHAILEPPCHDKEKLLLGFTTRSKTMLVSAFLLPPLLVLLDKFSLQLLAISNYSLSEQLTLCAYYWLGVSGIAVGGNTLILLKKYGLRTSLIWFVKLITDPFTDVIAYYPSIFKLWNNLTRRSA